MGRSTPCRNELHPTRGKGMIGDEPALPPKPAVPHDNAERPALDLACLWTQLCKVTAYLRREVWRHDDANDTRH